MQEDLELNLGPGQGVQLFANRFMCVSRLFQNQRVWQL